MTVRGNQKGGGKRHYRNDAVMFKRHCWCSRYEERILPACHSARRVLDCLLKCHGMRRHRLPVIKPPVMILHIPVLTVTHAMKRSGRCDTRHTENNCTKDRKLVLFIISRTAEATLIYNTLNTIPFETQTLDFGLASCRGCVDSRIKSYIGFPPIGNQRQRFRMEACVSIGKSWAYISDNQLL